MTRQEYYKQVEKGLKLSCKIPMNMEFYNETTWTSLNLYEEEIPIEARYRLHFSIGNVDFSIQENAFDKFYLPMIGYADKRNVDYRENDIGITINNLRYAIINEFQKYFLQPYNF